jgi:cytochrome c heme-lyase
MGSASSKPEATSLPPLADDKTVGGCPVKHNGKVTGPSPSTSAPSDSCPVKHGHKTIYNVYSQPIDSSNQMPSIANQLPAPQQQKALNTDRVSSTIPKGNTDDQTWTYPSPQMFYNALVRKGKLGDTSEDDMDSVVALHNNMNERTWSQVKEWERLAGEEYPKLLKFQGRPTDLSPKARLKHWLYNHPLPFDRHDWTVQRRDGSTVRYVIDYYHDESKSSEEEGSGMPKLTDPIPSLLVDVRPALDRPSDLYQRAIAMPQAQRNQATDFDPLPFAPSEEMKSQVSESLIVWENIQKNKKGPMKHADISEQEAMKLADSLRQALDQCSEAKERVNRCKTDIECQQASLDLTTCFGKLWCPLQHEAMMKALRGSSNDNDVQVALENLTNCVTTSQQRMSEAKSDYPKVFANIK